MWKALFGSTLKAGSQAPGFELLDQSGTPRSLQEFRGKWLVLYFYPKDETRGCTQEACSFRDTREDFSQLDAQVVGISVDDVASHKAFAENHGLNFPILADITKQTSRAYGVLSPLGFANRVTFLISPEGQIKDIVEWANWATYGQTVAAKLKTLRST